MNLRTPIRLLSTDLDGTLLGDDHATRRFKDSWLSLPPALRPFLVYNSGRLIDDLRRFVDHEMLPVADYLIGGVGTQVSEVATGRMFDELHTHFTQGWDLARVREIAGQIPGIRAQPDQFQHAFKSSWFLEHAEAGTIRDLEAHLAAAGLQAQVVYSSARDLDVLPREANKGGALVWLCDRLRLPLTQVLVAGDTANDTSVFHLPGVRGIVVGNAQAELPAAIAETSVFQSARPMADGVVDGLRHFGVLGTAQTRAA